MRSQPVLGSASEGGIIMKKLLRWLGYGLLLGCVLVGGYCVFLSSGLAERVFPPAVPGCMAVPVLSPSREEAFAAQEKEAGRVQLFITGCGGEPLGDRPGGGDPGKPQGVLG